MKKLPLYYRQPTVVEYETLAKSVERDGNLLIVTSGESIFFPGGGGQPPDRGTINGMPLLETVLTDDGAFRHKLELIPASQVGVAPGDNSECRPSVTVGSSIYMRLDTDWRLDVSQQHTGQHLLSAVCFREFGFQTVGFHLGFDLSTIDLDIGPLDTKLLKEVQRLVNRMGRQALPVVSSSLSLTGTDLLRKQPPATHNGEIRIARIGDYDAVPCCGTHLASTAEAIPFLIIKQSRMRGLARIHFLAGCRAEDFASLQCARLSTIAANLDTTLRDVLERIDSMLNESSRLRSENRKLREELITSQIESVFLSQTRKSSPPFFVSKRLEDTKPGALASLCRKLCTVPARILLLYTTRGDKTSVCLSCSDDIDMDCSSVLAQVLSRGGGSRSQAQGVTPAAQQHEVIPALISIIESRL